MSDQSRELKDDVDHPLLVSKRGLAQILGCSEPTVDQLMIRHRDLPIETRGGRGREYQFDAQAVVDYLQRKRDAEREAEQLRARRMEQFSLAIGDEAESGADGLTPSQRIAVARAKLLERKLALESGFLVSVGQVRQGLTVLVGELGKFFDSLPDQIAQRHGLDEEAGRSIRKMIDEQRVQFVDRVRQLFGREAPQSAEDGQWRSSE